MTKGGGKGRGLQRRVGHRKPCRICGYQVTYYKRACRFHSLWQHDAFQINAGAVTVKLIRYQVGASYLAVIVGRFIWWAVQLCTRSDRQLKLFADVPLALFYWERKTGYSLL